MEDSGGAKSLLKKPPEELFVEEDCALISFEGTGLFWVQILSYNKFGKGSFWEVETIFGLKIRFLAKN